MILLISTAIAGLILFIIICPQKQLDKLVYWILKRTNQLDSPIQSEILVIEHLEKPKREFVEHDNQLLEVVDCEKPKRGNDGIY